MVAVELTPQTIERIALRVAQLVRREQIPARTPEPAVLLTVKELARRLKLNPAWVYEHADELGAIRTGSGPKARIRFEPQAASEALRRRAPRSSRGLASSRGVASSRSLASGG